MKECRIDKDVLTKLTSFEEDFAKTLPTFIKQIGIARRVQKRSGLKRPASFFVH